jgi:hypothetical protein
MGLNYYLAVVLSSRPVDYDKCSLNYLTKRFSNAERLSDVPDFETLPSLNSGLLSYGGKLNIYHLKLDDGCFAMELIASFSSSRKIQHACFMETDLLVCFEDSLEIWSNWQGKAESIRVCLIDDNWFAGLHTVSPLGISSCLVSSSSADAAMVVDLKSKSVVSRYRLPKDIYKNNYSLRESDSLKSHYIPNDLQLGHLNSAFPDENKNIWVSTLIQGDIGVFDVVGNYKQVMTGYVGAHGVRCIKGKNRIYFSDSCLGVLIIATSQGQIIQRYSTESKWMHDVHHMHDDLFLLGLSDLGKIVLADVATGAEQQFHISSTEGYIQFFCLHEF